MWDCLTTVLNATRYYYYYVISESKHLIYYHCNILLIINDIAYEWINVS